MGLHSGVWPVSVGVTVSMAPFVVVGLEYLDGRKKGKNCLT
jgi:hypothetical protein